MSESVSPQSVLEIFEKQQIVDAFTQKIGEGSEAKVYVGSLPEFLRKQIAFKLFHQVKDSREIENLKKLDHPNIIKFLATVVQNCGEAKKPCGYLMDYMEGKSLYSLALERKDVYYNFRPIYTWIEESSSGLLYLHDKGIIHRDLNPKNILLAKEFSLCDPTTWTIRISDFGMARSITSGSITEGVGTPLYQAPEVSERNYGPKADVFSLTVTIGVVMFRKKPYPEYFINSNLPNLIRNGLRPTIEGEVAGETVDIELNKFFIKGWSGNEAHRPDLLDINNFAKARQQDSRSPFILTKLPKIPLNLAEISEFEMREISKLGISWSEYVIYKKTVYAEGCDKSTKIRQAIAFVIKNRRDNNAWYGGKTFEGVCRHRAQFSSWNGRDSIQITNQEIFAEIGSWLPLILKGEMEDPTFGADHFHSRIHDPNANHFSKLLHTVRIEEIDFYLNPNIKITVPMSGWEESQVVPQGGENSSDEMS